MRGGVASALRRRRRVRLDLLLGALAVLAVAAAILVQQGTASSQDLAPSSPDSALTAFARAYVSYLDGRLPARSLPNASDRVRAIAGGSPPIPAVARRGALELAALRVTYVRGALSAQAAALGRDGAHTYGFTLDLRFANGEWQVSYLVAPDVYTITAAPYRRPVAPRTLRTAASTFALAYGAFREGARSAPPAGASTIEEQIAAGRDPLAGTAPSHAEPRLVAVAFGPAVGGVASATATLTDQGQKLQFDFDLREVAGGWQAWGFPEAG